MRKILSVLFAGLMVVSMASCCSTSKCKNMPAMQDVESSMIESVGYDAEAQVLVVEFVSGDEVFIYESVPQAVYDEMMAAESKGSYYSNNIKGKYKSSKK